MLHRALFWCTLTTFAWAGGVQKSLFPGVSVDDEAVHFANGVSRYLLQNLKPKTGYEVRVSYPATLPSKVYLRLISGGSQNPQQHHRRSLLDTEKLILYTGHNILDNYVVDLQAEATGIHRDGPDAIPKVFHYNIVLVQLLYGLPVDTLPVVGMVIVGLLAVWLMLPWWMSTAVPAILNFMEGSQGVLTAERNR